MNCFATLSSREFLPGTRALLNSLVRNSGTLNCDFVVMSHDLDEADLDGLKRIYQGTKLVPIDAARHLRTQEYINTATPWTQDIKIRFSRMFFKFEVFGLEEYDRIVYLDSDTLVLGDVSELMSLDCDFGAVMDGYGVDGFNGGVLVIGRKHIGRKTVEELIRLAEDMIQSPSIPKNTGYTMTDQAVLNRRFGQSFRKIDGKYNFFKSSYKTMGSWLSDVRVLHFVMDKPWENRRLNGLREADDMTWDQYGV